MKLTFLGTGSGRTSLNRFHSSLMFSVNNENILVDVGDSISRNLQTKYISFNSITHIILTHHHSDHLAGLPSLLTQMIIENRSTPLKIYSHSELVNSFIKFLQISGIFIETLNFSVEIVSFIFEKELEVLNQLKFSAKQNSHITNKHQINIDEIKFISSSFLFGFGNKKIIYTSDVGSSEDLYLFNNIHSDIFITEATHVKLDEIAKAEVILKPTKVYLTHIDDEKTVLIWFQNLSELKKNYL